MFSDYEYYGPRVTRTPYASNDELCDDEDVQDVKIEINNLTGDQKKQKKDTKNRRDYLNLMDKEENAKRLHNMEVKELKKKAGLLDSPSNYMLIGVAAYNAKKKEENLYNITQNAKNKAKYNKKIQEHADDKFVETFDKFRAFKDENGEPIDIPDDIIDKIAVMEMKMQQYLDSEIIGLKYPFLKL
jgi:hypothetical protein